MNKQFHRVIFNAARGQRMAVHEAASSSCGRCRLQATAIGAIAMLAWPAISVQAQIAGDPSAPGNQRPVVIHAPNGTPLVNIQTPSAAGVSRNTYRQFDVGAQGAILNNSRGNAQTQLGGWVQGNPWLAREPAAVILNEVNSANPSQLRGYVEVAGQRAEVIIANPAGIQVNGAGFINASRATLTTGVPQFNAAGGLDSFLVQGGTISVDGAGLDAGKTDYAAILARAVQVNAGIWANELKVVAGANQVSADAGSATPVAGTGSAPAFALDVAQLGGMYAGKITLVGTEAGVGVRNAGDLGAGAGGLVVTADGRLENVGTLRGDRVQASSTGGNLENRGTIEARSIELASAADVVNSGTIRQTGANTLAVQAPGLSNTRGGYVGAEPVAAALPASASTDAPVGLGQTTPAGSGGTAAAGPAASTDTTPVPAPPAQEAPIPGRIAASGTLRNEGGRIYTGGDIHLQTPVIDNSGGTLSVGDLAVSGPKFSNAGGTLNVRNGFNAEVGSFDNAGGTINAGGVQVKTDAGGLDNRAGKIRSNGSTQLQVAGDLLSSGGEITSIGGLDATVQGQVDNANGQLAANGQLRLQAGSLNNTGSATVRGGTGSRIDVVGVLRNEGSITSGADTRITAASLQGTSSSTLGAGIQADGSLGPQGTLDISAAQDLQAHGALVSAGQMNLQASGIDLSGSSTSAAAIHATASAGSIDTSAARIVTPGALSLQADADASQALVNTGGTLNAGQLDLRLANIRNTQGAEISQVGSQALQISLTGTLDNSGGRIVSNGDVAIEAARVINQSGQVRAAASEAGADGNLRVSSAGPLDNSEGGKLVADATLTIVSAALDNTGGQASGKAVSIDTRGGAFTNRAGTLSSTEGDLVLATGALDNSAGVIGAQGKLDATTTAIANGSGGVIGSNGDLRVNTQGNAFDNRGGQAKARGDLRIDAGGIDNSAGGLIRSDGTATLNAATLVNRDTQGTDQGIEAVDLGIQAASVDNTRGAIRAAGNGTLTSGGRIDNSAGLISAKSDLTLQDVAGAGADPSTKQLDVVNTGGTLVANQDLRIDAARLSNDGTTTAGRDLDIALTQDVVTSSDVSATRSLRYRTTGQFTNSVRLSAGGELSIEGQLGVDNKAGGELSGADVAVRTAGTFNNEGLVNSAAHTQVDAGTLNNLGGRIYGDRISVAAGTLNNGRAGSDGKGGVIATRTGDIDLGVAGELNNRDDALISSGGGLYIGGGLDEDRMATGRAAKVVNSAADIDSAGSMLMGAQALDNLNVGFTTKEQTTSEAVNLFFIRFPGDSKLYAPDELGKCYQCGDQRDSGADALGRLEWVRPSERYPFDAGYARKPYALPSAGASYEADDPVWKLFKVSPGDTAALNAALAAYNADYMGRSTRDFDEVRIDNRQTTETVVDNKGRAGLIRSGGDMTLDIGAGRNVNSQVIAGGSLGGSADSLRNEGVTGARTEVETGTWTSEWVRYKGNRLEQGRRGTNVPVENRETQSIDITIAEKLPNDNPGVVGKNPDAARLGQASASAGGTGAAGNAGHPGTLYEVKAATADTGSSGAASTPAVIRTSTPDTTLPRASLFSVRASGSYLVETDPRFANYRAWLSSDYLLNNLGLDPLTTEKRLGDGYYEQRLIREQVAQLTGSRYLERYTSDEDMYLALMYNGATFARQFQLTPGIGLTAAQMAQLTSDIVWLVEQDVTLPDGSVQKVLVPQLYVRVKEGDIQGNGALIAGNSVDLKIHGNLTSTEGATVAGRTTLKIDAGSIDVLNGARITGADVDLKSKEDINVIGASVDATNSLSAHAGRDLNVKSTTSSASASTSGYSSSNTQIDRVAGLYVGAGGKGALTASAGHDVNLIGAVIANQGGDPVAKGTGTSSALDRAIAGDINKDGDSAQGKPAAGTVVIGAGNDVSLGTLTIAEATNYQGKSGNYANFSQSQEVGSRVYGNGGVQIQAGHDANLRAATVATQGDLTVTAKNDVNLQAGQSFSSATTATNTTTKSGLKKTTTSSFDSTQVTDVVSTSLSGNSVQLVAGNDINTQAAQLRSDEAMTLAAGRDINVSTAIRTTEETHASQSKTSATGLGKFVGGALLGSGVPGAEFAAAAALGGKSGANASTSTSQEAVGTTISAGSLKVVSGRDTKLQAATVVADDSLTVVAGRNLTIESAQNTRTESGSQSSSRSGMVGEWTNPAIGKLQSSDTSSSTATTQTGSQVASLKGDVTLVAGEQYRQTASSVMALGQGGQGADGTGGNINILAKNVLINEATNVEQTSARGKSSSTVVGGNASVGGISTDAARSLASSTRAAGDSGDTRMQALAAANVAFGAKNAYDTASQLANGGPTGYKVGATLSHNKSEYETTSTTTTAVGSSIVGANNVNIVATGGGLDSNIHAIGSTIAAGKTVNLSADNKVVLEASKNTLEQSGTNKSSGQSVGVAFAGGSQNGVTIDLGASRGKGSDTQSEVTYNNTRVSGGEGVNITSGGDLDLKGAVVEGKRINADVGGNLNIESLQDTSQGQSRQSSSGVNLSLCIPPLCYGISTVGGNAARARADGDFQSVNGQSGLKAGDGGFSVNVKGNTDLKGGVIESTQAAIDAGKNGFKTGGTLTLSDLQNASRSDAKGYSVSGTVGTAAGNTGANAVPGGGAGAGRDSTDQASVTKSGISGIAGDQSVRTGDPSSAGTLVKDWNTQAAVQNVQNQAQITQQFNQNAAREIGNYADRKYRELKDTNPEEAAKWAEGGVYRVAAHSAAGLLSGGVGGALANGVTASVMPAIGAQIAGLGLPEPVQQALGAATAAAIGGLVGGTAGASAAFSTDINNRQLHPTEQDALRKAQRDKTPDEQKRLADAACALVGCANGLSPLEPGYADAVASQARGQQYLHEQDVLRGTGLFDYTGTDRVVDSANSTAKTIALVPVTTRQVVGDLLNGASHDFQTAVASQNPPQLPPDYPGDNGSNTGGGSAGAVVTPPLVACTPAGCVMAPPVATATIGSPGFVPSNATLNSGNGDGGKGNVTVEAGAKPDANEVRAGEGLANSGYIVVHQPTANSQGIQGVRTADLFIDGVGQVDVYTPKTETPLNAIARAVEAKADQANGVLVQTNISQSDMALIAARTWGKPSANSLTTLFFQQPDGLIVRFNRPFSGK